MGNNKNNSVVVFGFESLKAMTRNSSLFWDITECRVAEVKRSFGEQFASIVMVKK
jgi:hypothetical protein